MFKADAKIETDAMWSRVIELGARHIVEEAEDKPTAKLVHKTTWLYGNDPKLHFCSSTPFAAALCKALAAGSTKFVLVEVASWLQAKASHKENVDINLQALCDEIRDASLDRVAAMREKNCKIVHFEQEPWDVIYIPVGWNVLERTKAGSLVYGTRKSVAVATPTSFDNYNSMMRLSPKANTKGNITALLAEIAAHVGVGVESDDEAP